ncbi:uncharacterized protein PHACADRAFT_256597 [Phanerochaete carnosa HHB-10118-sp]|uniref:Uncharacterized protein n=1 Tax=Phanerochaete carnosa (strain HHB-10118-sp) TaxID=650164 RepID=K5W960_PHACS|nr:uncharacterized protein PHACADRAFT_256597 [Phanerochaete carnosa HHB-10118-sp]EKM55745.1 hypothetical protein PHACADRAFT_256597 [Phanerochaete carnosa HHB-10118-sp]
MPSSTILHAACFAVGALVGGGVATAISRNNTAQRPVAVPVPASESVKQPIVEVQPSGAPKLSTPGTLVKTDSQLLRYGHPGPVSDLLVRKAYVAAYDRRLRHPAWVCLLFNFCRNAQSIALLDC